MQVAPFVIFGLPRSRTTWLSQFLTYGNWNCGHDQLRHMRSLDDVYAWLSQDCTGSAETAAAPFWRLLQRYRPDARVLVVRRPVEAVVESLMALDTQGAGTFDRASLTKAMGRLDAKLDQIEARWPGPLLSVSCETMDKEAIGREIFEFCLPYKFDGEWWNRLSAINIQSSVPAMMRYATAFRPQLAKLGAIAKHAMLSDLALREPPDVAGLTIQEESFDRWYGEGQALFAEHLIGVGEAPEDHLGKNLELMRNLDQLGNMQIMVARSNGRMFGYLMSVLSPSLEAPDLMTAIQTTFYASKDFPGLGTKLQRASIAALKAKGIGEVFFRAGPRGDGPKMGVLYRRLGAQDDGEMYRLNLGS